MRTSECERRRLALEKQYQEDLELIRDAHHARLRALEMLWIGSPLSEGAVTEQAPAAGGDLPRQEEAEGPAVKSVGTQTESGTQRLGETQTASETQKDPGVVRGRLPQAIRNVLPQLPEIFDRQAVEKALGFAPPRSTLARILRDMWGDNELEIVESTEGRRPTKYRRVRR